MFCGEVFLFELCCGVASQKTCTDVGVTSLVFISTIFQRCVIHLMGKRHDSKDQISEGQG
jgi:hypothetical protein